MIIIIHDVLSSLVRLRFLTRYSLVVHSVYSFPSVHNSVCVIAISRKSLVSVDLCCFCCCFNFNKAVVACSCSVSGLAYPDPQEERTL